MRAASAMVASDRAMLLDGAVIAAVSAAICLAADRLVLMSALVPALLILRFALFARLDEEERGPLRAELLLFGVCLLLGAFNDWNSVCRHGVYDYTVPVFFPERSSIPIWMLLYWGMILRALVTLFCWERLARADRAPPRLTEEVRLGRWRRRSGWLKIGLLLLMVLITRQLIYRFYEHPIYSWLPFLVALLTYPLLFGLSRAERRLLLLFVIVGPAVEALYIKVGGLHRYHLGWIAGVPLWILLWWLLSVLIWRDLSLRLRGWLLAGHSAGSRPLEVLDHGAGDLPGEGVDADLRGDPDGGREQGSVGHV